MRLYRPRTASLRRPSADNGLLRAYATGAGLGVLKPSAATTGTLPDVEREDVAGNVSLGSDWSGEVYENKTITGSLSLTSADITVRNVRARELLCTNANVLRAVIEDCHFEPFTPATSDATAMRGHDFTARRVYCRGHIDGVNIFNASASQPYASGVVMEHIWVDGLAYWTASTTNVVHPNDTFVHADGIQHQGGWGTVLRGSRIDAHLIRDYAHWRCVGDPDTEPFTGISLNSLPDGGPWHAIPDRGDGTLATGRYNTGDNLSLTPFLIGNNVGTSRELVIDKNWFSGGEVGLNGGGFPRNSETNHLLTITDNRYSRDQGVQETGGDATATIGSFGSGWGAYVTRSGNVYEDNGNAVTIRAL